MEGSLLFYDSEYGCLSKEKSGCVLADIANVIAPFQSNSDWEDLNEVDETNDFYFVTVVEYGTEYRYLMVNIYLVDDSGNLITDPEQTGKIIADIYDPYIYEWPSDGLRAFLGFDLAGPSGENLLYTYTEYDDEGDVYYIAIEIFGVTESGFTNYVTVLNRDGWNLQDAYVEGFTDSDYSYEGEIDDVTMWLDYYVDDSCVTIGLFSY